MNASCRFGVENPPNYPAAELEPDPASVGANWMRAMRRGDFAAAWRETDRLELPRRAAEKRQPKFSLQPHHLLWNGAALEGKRVVIYCNHGLGDTIQFVRFCRRIGRVARHVSIMAQPDLLPLLRTTPALGEVLDGWSAPEPEHDVALEVMELAYALRCRADALAEEIPTFDLAAVARQARPLPAGTLGPGRRIGLVWAASSWDERRSVPLPALAPWGLFEALSFHSLQQGPRAPEGRRAPFPLRLLTPLTHGLLEAAAAILRLDLVITVDTVTAHLAGALGRPTWLLLPRPADWRWQDEGSTTPWYPTLRLFRQSEPGDWRPVIAQVARELESFARGERPLQSTLGSSDIETKTWI